ncbi:MAG: site-2 protease family protein [Chloroflexota bacterium]|nr:site-2 protease family protein [Chloroflexota bacterium]
MHFITSILTLSVIITPLIILHEFAHFFTAKLFKVKILEFGIGFPPRIYGFWTNEQEYKISPNLHDSLLKFNNGEVVNVSFDENVVNSIEKINEDNSQIKNNSMKVKISNISNQTIKVKTMIWSINIIPLGGFVRLFGEEANISEGSLSKASYIQRFIILFSGSLVNFIIPFLMVFTVYLIISPNKSTDIIVQSVIPNSPAELAGIRSGDKIVKIDQKEIFSINDLQNVVTQNLGKEVLWVVERGIPIVFSKPGDKSKYQYNNDFNEILVVGRWNPPRRSIPEDMTLTEARKYDPYAGTVTELLVSENAKKFGEISLNDAKKFGDYYYGEKIPIVIDANDDGIDLIEARKIDNRYGIRNFIQEGSVGILISEGEKKILSQSINDQYKFALRNAVDIYSLSFISIKGLINRSTNPIFDGPKAVGPIGLGDLSGKIVESENTFSTKIVILITLASSISLSLAIINLLPFPALDGGRIAFLFVEILRKGKKVPERVESYIHGLGFIILILMIIFISIKDIARL